MDISLGIRLAASVGFVAWSVMIVYAHKMEAKGEWKASKFLYAGSCLPLLLLIGGSWRSPISVLGSKLNKTNPRRGSKLKSLLAAA